MKDNRRTRYTKNMIQKSLLALLKEEKLNRVSVKAICQMADINRSTFYSHYQDVFHLVEQMEADLIQKVMKKINLKNIERGQQQKVFLEIFQTIQENRDEFKLILLNPESTRCLERFFEEAYRHTKALIQEKHDDLTESTIQHVYGFISRGCAQMVQSWILCGMKETPEEMAKLLDQTLQGRFS